MPTRRRRPVRWQAPRRVPRTAERADLADVCDSHRGRTGIELACQQLWRHVRLAVRRQVYAVAATPLGHRRQVVLDRRGVEHAHGSHRAGVEEFRLLSADLCRSAAPPRRRHSLVPPVQRFVGQCAHSLRSRPVTYCPPSSDNVTRSLSIERHCRSKAGIRNSGWLPHGVSRRSTAPSR